MENKVLFLSPLCIGPRFKRGTEGLIGASILGGTGLMSGILGSSSASANNKAMIEYNQWAQKDAQAYNTKMYERQLADQEAMYNKYQSPEAIAQQLRAAGINPSALAAGQGFSGGSMSSVPSAGASPVTQLSGLQNTGTPIGQGLQAAASAIADLSHANESDAYAKATSEKLSHEVNLLLARQRSEQAIAINTELQNSLTQKYGDKKWSAEIGHLSSMAYANWAQGDLNAAEANYKDVLRQLANFQLDMDNETRSYLIGKVVESYNLLKAQVASEKTVPGLNRASAKNQSAQASLNSALAKTENALREGKVDLQSLSLDLGTIQKFISGNDLKLSDETLQAKIFGTIEKMYREGLISENVYMEGQILSTKRDWAARQEFANYLGNVVGAASNAFNAYTNYRGVSVNRLNAKERNQIQDKFVDEYVRQSRQKSSAHRSAVLGPDYEMYSDQFFGR